MLSSDAPKVFDNGDEGWKVCVSNWDADGLRRRMLIYAEEDKVRVTVGGRPLIATGAFGDWGERYDCDRLIAGLGGLDPAGDCCAGGV